MTGATYNITLNCENATVRYWNLGEGKTVVIVVPIGMTPRNVTRLSRYVEALIAETAIAWDEPKPSEPGTGGSTP